MGHEKAMQNAAEVLQSVVPALEKHDVRIAIEPLVPRKAIFLTTLTKREN